MITVTGLAKFVPALRHCQAASIRFAPTGVQAGLERRLAITGLATVFDRYSSVADALQHPSGQRG
ncbi:hypothetical protein ACQEVF_11070 [Nonomuraea polychroma]|uniref:hypothetical protein n=1 Tax=Nonomuraea polychroma TaxID=46176 RepID=UPI003D8EE709